MNKLNRRRLCSTDARALARVRRYPDLFKPSELGTQTRRCRLLITLVSWMVRSSFSLSKTRTLLAPKCLAGLVG